MNSHVTAPSHNGALDKHTTNCRVSKKPKSVQSLSCFINKLQKVVQTHTTRAGVRDCSKFATQSSVTVRINKGGGGARACGLNRCLNTTTCPRCSHMLSVKRAKEIDSVVIPMVEDGGDAFMLTLTIPHLRKDKFNDLRKIINKCWHSLMRQKFGKRLGKFCSDGNPVWVRAFDYTMGRNGHHMHFHNLLVTEHSVSDEEFQELEFIVKDCWLKLLEKFGDKIGSADAIKLERAYDVSGVSKYNNKITRAAFEVASRGTTKQSKDGSMNIWELVSAIDTEVDFKARAKLISQFRRFEKDTNKLRTITYSKGFKLRLEVPEWEEVKEKMEEETQEVVKIRTDLWFLIRKNFKHIPMLEMINHWSWGCNSDETRAGMRTLVKLCHRYNAENGSIDDQMMHLDYQDFSDAMDTWERWFEEKIKKSNHQTHRELHRTTDEKSSRDFHEWCQSTRVIFGDNRMDPVPSVGRSSESIHTPLLASL